MRKNLPLLVAIAIGCIVLAAYGIPALFEALPREGPQTSEPPGQREQPGELPPEAPLRETGAPTEGGPPVDDRGSRDEARSDPLDGFGQETPSWVLLRVVGKEDEPIAGAKVTARDEPGEVTRKTDVKGEVRLPVFGGRVSGLWRVRIHAKGWAPTSTWIPLDATEHRVRLDPGLSLRGSVVGPEDSALEGARIRAWPGLGGSQDDAWGVVEARSDADGRFALHALGDGPLEIQATHPGLVAVPLTLRADQRSEEVTIRFGRSREIRVQVVDEGGDPQPGATVRGVARRSWGIRGVRIDEARADDQGRVTLRDIPEDARWVRLAARAPGYGEVRRTWQGEEAEKSDLEIVVWDRETILRGVVQTPGGAPVLGRVAVDYRLEEGGGPRNVQVTVGPDGHFETRDIPAGARFDLRFYWEPPGSPSFAGALARADAMRLDAGEEREIDLTVPELVPVRLRCSTPDGAPAGGIFIRLGSISFPSGDRDPVNAGAYAGPDGLAEVMLIPGTYRCEARRNFWVLREMEVSIGSEGETVEIEVDGGQVITGTVRDEAGEPVGLRILKVTGNRFRKSSTTDESGRFSLSGLPPWPLALQVEGTRGETGLRVEEVRAGGPPLDLVLESGTITGRITDRTTGKPLEGIVQCRRSGWKGYWNAKAGPDGRYEIRDLSAGEWSITALVRGYLELRETVSGSKDAVVDFPVQKGGTLRIVSLPPDVQSGTVILSLVTPPEFQGGRSIGTAWRSGKPGQGAAGLYEPGRYEVRVTAGEEKRTLELSIVAGEITVFDWAVAVPKE